MYYSLVHSHLIYGIQIRSSGSSTNITNLFKLQKKAIRLVHSVPYNSHTESLFKSSNLLPLPILVDFFRLQFMHQFTHGHLPISFLDTWTSNADRLALAGFGRANYNLRNSEDLYTPYCRTAALERHPLFLFPRLWTEFNELSIKFIRDKTEFNFKLKKHMISKLESNYRCTRLFCPHCSRVPMPNPNPDDVDSE